MGKRGERKISPFAIFSVASLGVNPNTMNKRTTLKSISFTPYSEKKSSSLKPLSNA